MFCFIVFFFSSFLLCTYLGTWLRKAIESVFLIDTDDPEDITVSLEIADNPIFKRDRSKFSVIHKREKFIVRIFLKRFCAHILISIELLFFLCVYISVKRHIYCEIETIEYRCAGPSIFDYMGGFGAIF